MMKYRFSSLQAVVAYIQAFAHQKGWATLNTPDALLPLEWRVLDRGDTFPDVWVDGDEYILGRIPKDKFTEWFEPI